MPYTWHLYNIDIQLIAYTKSKETDLNKYKQQLHLLHTHITTYTQEKDIEINNIQTIHKLELNKIDEKVRIMMSNKENIINQLKLQNQDIIYKYNELEHIMNELNTAIL